MSTDFLTTSEYQDFITQLKRNIQQARNTAIRKVNAELIGLYFNIGKQIVAKQKESKWGDGLIGQIEKDIKLAFPDIKGFSRRNLMYMKNFYLFFGEGEIVQRAVGQIAKPVEIVQRAAAQFLLETKVPQAVAQIPWGHIRIILDEIKNLDEAEFYIRKTIEHSWSRAILNHQISLRLYERQGKILSNFDNTVQTQDLSLLKQSFKDSYILDFLELTEDAKERDLEIALVNNISRFILELGKGFAFVGKQYKLTIGGQEFFIDLLFYNYILRRFIVVELKTTEFRPEYVGQISFYLTTIDRDIKQEEDGGTIGLIICKNKNNTVVEYALGSSTQPTGVAEYKLFSELPEDMRRYLPSEEDLKGV